jgi:hypothetical protein
MTPKQVTTIDLKELKELELRCECGASIRFPLPMTNQLPAEQECLACHRKLWAYQSPVLLRITKLLNSIRDWTEFEQTVLTLSFVVTEKLPE